MIVTCCFLISFNLFIRCIFTFCLKFIGLILFDCVFVFLFYYQRKYGLCVCVCSIISSVFIAILCCCCPLQDGSEKTGMNNRFVSRHRGVSFCVNVCVCMYVCNVYACVCVLKTKNKGSHEMKYFKFFKSFFFASATNIPNATQFITFFAFCSDIH